MSRIERLTAEQEALLPVWAEKWTKIGLCTEPANRTEAEKYLRMAYRLAGLDEPHKVIWFDSPLGAGLGRFILQNRSSVRSSVRASVGSSVGSSVRDSVGDNVWDSAWASVRDNVRDNVWDSAWASVRDSVGASVRASVWDSVRDNVWASAWDNVRASVRDNVWDSAWDSVRDSVGDNVRDSVWDSVRDNVWASVRDSVWDSGYGQHDASWLRFMDYFREVVGLSKQTEKLMGLIEHAKYGGWYIPHKNIIFASDRHHIVSLDNQNRIHSLAGPAVGYRDGFSIYAIHGAKVQEHVVMRPESITVPEIESESNVEVRRVMIDQYGQDRYLVDSGAEIINQDNYGTLYRKPQANDEPVVMVKVVNSTPEPDGSFKDYFLRVPPTVQTACEAVAWTFGLDQSEYKPEVES